MKPALKALMSAMICGQLWLVPVVLAVIETYEFSSPDLELRYHQLSQELRCPKCQNQSIADSDAEISQDMRERVARMIREGHSDEEIVTFFVDRYGDFVSYRPPFNPRTAILWVGPLTLLLLGGVGIVLLVRRASREAEEDDQ